MDPKPSDPTGPGIPCDDSVDEMPAGCDEEPVEPVCDDSPWVCDPQFCSASPDHDYCVEVTMPPSMCDSLSAVISHQLWYCSEEPFGPQAFCGNYPDHVYCYEEGPRPNRYTHDHVTGFPHGFCEERPSALICAEAAYCAPDA